MNCRNDWFVHNGLSLNYSKTEFIDFGKSCRSTAVDKLSLQIDNRAIREVEQTKFLGVYLDKNLSWRHHIGNIILKTSQTVGIIGRARRFMDSPQLTLLYNTMVLPHLQYCLINWGNFKEDRNLKYRDRILTLQKCFLRIIYGTDRLAHADPLFAHMGALKIDDLFAQAVRVVAYKLSKNMLPAGMAALFHKIDHGHNTRGSKANLVVSRSDHRSIQYTVPKVWNSVTDTLKDSPSVASFKNNSKKDLLISYASFTCTTRGCRSCLSQPLPNP